jgi:hypothetical protein
MKYADFTLPDLEEKLESLADGSLFDITARDYERLFGINEAAMGRLRNFAQSHDCIVSFGDHGVIFRRKVRIKQETPQAALKLIRLELARSKEFPAGSDRHGYEFVAPLDAAGRIDSKVWKEHKDQCRVRRFWSGEEDQHGFLLHRPGGSEHAQWIFDYDRSRDDDDEFGYRFGAHAFVPSEYLTLESKTGEHTFKVISVEAIAKR